MNIQDILNNKNVNDEMYISDIRIFFGMELSYNKCVELRDVLEKLRG